ncbi:hypothetical protein diail_10319 [Diaporthe ilicicola]|nr:hypothetical protein diail_10319 [Diaporthe ilicicola]
MGACHVNTMFQRTRTWMGVLLACNLLPEVRVLRQVSGGGIEGVLGDDRRTLQKDMMSDAYHDARDLASGWCLESAMRKSLSPIHRGCDKASRRNCQEMGGFY